MSKYTLADCVRLAEFAHFHQTDKAGEPYVNHPKRVLVSVQAQGAPAYTQMAAVLHDVTEDTPFTPEMLLNLGVPEAAVEIVKLLDRDISKWVFLDEYYGGIGSQSLKPEIDKFYYAQIKKNPEAVKVKLADIGDNLQPWRLTYLPEDTQIRLRAKYAKAIEMLNPRPVNHGLINPDYKFNPYIPGGG